MQKPLHSLTQTSAKKEKQNVCILGATGSIGESTLKVLALHPEHFQVYALSGYGRLAQLADLCAQYQPTYVSVPASKGEQFFQDLKQRFPEAKTPHIVEGEAGLKLIAAHADVDVVMAAIVGAAGLEPTLAAVQAGKRVLLANKEALVMAGSLFMDCVRRSGAML
ncbi:MAG TPA: hypothetical protein VIH30_10615, partial [Aquirhabdus sp.]